MAEAVLCAMSPSRFSFCLRPLSRSRKEAMMALHYPGGNGLVGLRSFGPIIENGPLHTPIMVGVACILLDYASAALKR